MNSIRRRVSDMNVRLDRLREDGVYFYLKPLDRLEGAWVSTAGQRMLNFASYSYLDLLGHAKIDAAARDAIDRYGTGTHGVRMLAGTLPVHDELESTIANFKGRDAAIVYSSGYVTNLATVSALVGRNDFVICDRLNHASIVDGCLLSGARFLRFRHNDIDDLERRLRHAGKHAGKLVVVDAVFSMDGDITNLPEVSRLCRQYEALLMVDEAHSVGVLGETGHGIEEHFGLEGAIDLHMGTLSKTIPSVGGYVAGDLEFITYLKHAARAFVFSAALPPAQAAAATASIEVIEEEPERISRLRRNVALFLTGLRARGFNTLQSETPIVPMICGGDDRAFQMARLCWEEDIFVLPVVSPAVPQDLARLRANVTAAHSPQDIAYALDVFERAGRKLGVID